jgi:hypothetical protein
MKTPVALFIFNRIDTTKQVFDQIRKTKPSKLLVVADGPRTNRPGELEKCTQVRELIDQVDWDCKVIKNYSEQNLGCKQRVFSGLSWVFEVVDEAIILEDDCLPDLTFFQFCEELLEKYRDDERVMAIGGTNVLGRWKSDIQSYHFSYHGTIWGWASWRRAWNYYDVDVKLWGKQEVKNCIRSLCANDREYRYRAQLFESVYRQEVDTWDYQWMFTRFIQSGLTVLPAVNLVSNLGFGHADATHTKKVNKLANLNRYNLTFPLKIHEYVCIDREFEKALLDKVMFNRSHWQRVKEKVAKIVNNIAE